MAEIWHWRLDLLRPAAAGIHCKIGQDFGDLAVITFLARQIGILEKVLRWDPANNENPALKKNMLVP